MALFASESDVAKLASGIVGEDVGIDDGAFDAFGELLNTVGGRVRTCIVRRGITVDQSGQSVDLAADVQLPFDWALEAAFLCEEGAKLILSIAVEDLTAVAASV